MAAIFFFFCFGYDIYEWANVAESCLREVWDAFSTVIFHVSAGWREISSRGLLLFRTCGANVSLLFSVDEATMRALRALRRRRRAGVGGSLTVRFTSWFVSNALVKRE